MYEGRTVFTRGAAVTWMVAGATILFAAVTAVTWSQRGWDWLSVGLALATVVFGGGGLLEGFVERVELTPDALVVTRLSGKRSYPIDDIERVSEEKGGPPAVRLTNGRWVHLPSYCDHFGNSARAWLRANRQ